MSRSRPLRGLRRRQAGIPLVAFVLYVLWVDIGWASWDVWLLITFYAVVGCLTLTTMVSGVLWRSFTHLPPATGRVLAIVPVYNERPDHLREAVLALADQTVPIDEIHVIDDGSRTPVEPFDVPRVFWHRQVNMGKRHAQATVLRQVDRDDWDYVLTVDSDSVPDRDSLEHLLRAMSNPKVQAATGMILMRNWRDNLLTRLTDINIVTSCLMFRMIRSWLGVVSPTSGALALYRAELLFDNLEDYVVSGTAGDDRRLSFYGLLHGEVVGVSEAVVETHLPNTMREMFFQRLRWSKSAWQGIPFVLTNLRWSAVFFYMYPLVFALMWPLIVVLLIRISFAYDSPVLLYGFIYWEVVSIAMTGIYAVYRPNLTARERLTLWLLGAVYPVLGVVILRPASYWALTKLHSDAWHTRQEQPHAEPEPEPMPAPASAYVAERVAE